MISRRSFLAGAAAGALSPAIDSTVVSERASSPPAPVLAPAAAAFALVGSPGAASPSSVPSAAANVEMNQPSVLYASVRTCRFQERKCARQCLSASAVAKRTSRADPEHTITKHTGIPISRDRSPAGKKDQ